MLSFLTNEQKEEVQKKGYMCEHLLCFYSGVSEKTALYDDNFPVYFSNYGEVDIILFGIRDRKANGFECIRELFQLPIKELNIISPEELQIPEIKTLYMDWDYHIDVQSFDIELEGKDYKDIRYNLHRAEKFGYYTKISREFTKNHLYVLARHMVRHSLDVWDFEELLSLGNFFKEHDHGLMMEVYKQDKLIGFDVIDFFKNQRIMVVPLGIYLDEQSIADFIMYENLKYAKDNGAEWLDISLGCRNNGLQKFKKKWHAEPKYKLYVQTIKKS